MSNLLILGRQPALGFAELESLYDSTAVSAVGTQAALVDDEVDFNRLGGCVKACKLLTTLDTTEWRKIESYLIQNTPEHAAMLTEGKLTIGLSTYGLQVSPGTLNATGLSIKKAIRKASGRSVRLVPNNATELSSAQIYHNHLTAERAWELVLVADGNKTHLAQTFAVQDIDAYTLRDRGRPKRDARVGMLPPKLAQIIINLAVSHRHQALGIRKSELPDNALSLAPTILDPFCGTGVLLQEALLMGYNAYGTDLEPRMIDYSKTNLEWLSTVYDLPSTIYRLDQGDATSHHWNFSELKIPNPELVIACETYLGKPFTSRPDPGTLAKTVSEVDLILRKFLKNLHPQLTPGSRLCLAVPAWQTAPHKFKHLPIVDSLEKMGYNRVSFEHVRDDQLVYYREDQVVARQLLVITRK